MGKPLKKKIDEVEVLDSENEKTSEQDLSKGRFKLYSTDELDMDIVQSDEFKDFILKSEYVERNLALQKPSEEELNKPVSTSIKVYRGKQVQNVGLDELRDLIKTAKDIKQVVVEQVSIKEATRVSMLFEPDKEKVGERYNKLLSGSDAGPKEKIASLAPAIEENPTDEINSKKLIELESKLNNGFLEKENYQSETQKKNIESNQRLVRDRKPEEEKPESINLKEKVELKFKQELLPEEEEYTPQEIEEFSQVVQEEVAANKFKFKSTVDTTSLEKNDQDLSKIGKALEESEEDKELELKKVSFSKQTLTRKKGKVHNGYYYRAKDHVELFKMGSSYLRDFKDGIKSFAFSCVGLPTDREKTVFGVSAFFNYHSDVNMVIVTENFDSSFYSEFVGKFETEKRNVPEEDLFYKVHVAKGFEVIELTELGKIERKIRNYDFEDFLDHLVDSYDLVLWDLPEIDSMNSFKELYFPVIRTLDNVSLIVGQNKNMMDDITQMIEYFKRYQVTIKGLLFAPDRASDKKKGGTSD
ncbi:MAG: hypothetical protein HOM21_01430 [Halobacteriovoraceae bacterium]|nr:hypothetical protein [Halobacteriovoraceae bacterium]